MGKYKQTTYLGRIKMHNVKYLIIGNGIAGLSAAKEIRKNDAKGSIMMISKEPYLPYYRIRLTEFLSKDFKDEDILVHKDDWYQKQDIKQLLSKIVERIEIEESMVVLDDGMEIKYEKLLIATGSRPFIPPIAGKFRQGVLALRTLKDLKYIKNYIDQRTDITIIGGGLLGLEAAWALKKLGKNVNIIELAPYLLPKQLDEEIANKLEEKLTEQGFNIYLSSSVEEILGEAMVDGIKLNHNRKIETHVVLFSVGIIPNIDIVRNTPIEFNRGILVDHGLRTNIENIYAAGDVIECHGDILGLWSASNEQGKVAGANMSGQSMKYDKPKPFTMLQIGEIKLFSIGNIQNFDSVYEYKNEDKGVHHKLFISDNRIIGGILFGDVKDMGKLKKAIAGKVTIESYLEESLPFTKIL